MTERIGWNPLRRILLLVGLAALTVLVAQARAGVRPPPTPRAAPAVDVAPAAHDARRIEVAFVLDTTGSMSGLIEGAKRKIWSIADQLASARQRTEIRMGLIGYRDRGDAYVTRRTDLTTDLDTVYRELAALQAGGGGDGPESVNQALHEAVTRLSWSEGDDVYRVIFLVGDAPPHMDYAGDVPYATSAGLAARRGLAINTIQCGDWVETRDVWQEIARLGQGRYAAIAQDGAMVALEAPMDEQLAQLNAELAETVLAWGDVAGRIETREKVERSLAAAAPAAAARLSYLSKAGKRALAGAHDLVDAVKEGLVDLAAVEDETLPEELRGMDSEARREAVQQRLERRQQIQSRIDELVDERDVWVRSEMERQRNEGKGDGFDRRVLDAIREQAARAGIVYE